VREGVVAVHEHRAGEPQLVAYVALTTDDRRPTTDDRQEETGDQRQETGDSRPTTESRTAEPAHPLTRSPAHPLSGVVGGPWSVVAELRAFLQAALPDYMVPSAFVVLDRLPRTPNGKLDRRALPVPAGELLAGSSAYIAPHTPIQTILAEMWGEALLTTQVSIHDNFFDLGGHSLNATRIVSRIRQAFQITLAVRDLFGAPTVAALADYLVATETQPGRTDKIARTLQRLRRLSAADRQKILQQKKGSESI
jgi:acyl carrier protein